MPAMCKEASFAVRAEPGSDELLAQVSLVLGGGCGHVFPSRAGRGSQFIGAVGKGAVVAVLARA